MDIPPEGRKKGARRSGADALAATVEIPRVASSADSYLLRLAIDVASRSSKPARQRYRSLLGEPLAGSPVEGEAQMAHGRHRFPECWPHKASS